MSIFNKLSEHIRQKGLRTTFKKAWKHYVFSHKELLWMERDLISPVPPYKLRSYPPLQVVTITPENAVAFTRYFGDRVDTMAELAREGYTGHMHVDDQGDAVAFIWGAARDYYDKHYYGCTFPVKKGEFFEFGGELTRAYWGTALSMDLQTELWKAMLAQGCNKVVDVCEFHNVPALKLHIRTGYNEQGRIMNVYELFGRWRFYRESHYSGSRLDALRKPAREPATAAAT
ncbi:RimJ/RimL family protein N-acetyltransferase [Pseudomonas sp. JAI111]|uniref:N-acetyltransferase n=1 Tax=Pseudomonas sp. JAI111 TaxID=2735913 RepID=UPI002169FDED|nr:N-acetyltransferase [Pseudomonas sp. JAI111]MCS3838229.1 RimJ/RimL family protein N-acetyltransferase [Pseudomonas sp. JAI111]